MAERRLDFRLGFKPPPPKRGIRVVQAKVSIKAFGIEKRHCRTLLSMIGVPTPYQDQFIVRSKIAMTPKLAWTVRMRAAARWVLHYESIWNRYIKDLKAKVAALPGWPEATPYACARRLIMIGLLNSEASICIQPYFPDYPKYLLYLSISRARERLNDKLPPELRSLRKRYKKRAK